MKPARPVTREYDIGERRPIMITLRPDGMIVLREKGSPHTFDTTVAQVFFRTVRGYVLSEVRERETDAKRTRQRRRP